MDRYQRVERPRPESSAINENEIRITTQGLIRNYIAYANNLLQEKHAREIVLKAMGQAISKAVAIAEIIKKRTPGLHQDTAISSTSITDVWEPIEEGLVPLEMTRHVSMISISLSTRELNKNSSGYQPPFYVEPPRPQRQYLQQQQYQPKQSPGPGTEDSYGQVRGRGRGRGRGRNWGGRGGYGGGYGDGGYGSGGYGGGGYGGGDYGGGYDGGYGGAYDGGYGGGYSGGYGNQENGGWNYNNWNRGGGRVRGWGYRGAGYERGRGNGGGRGYPRGRGGRMINRGRGNQG